MNLKLKKQKSVEPLALKVDTCLLIFAAVAMVTLEVPLQSHDENDSLASLQHDDGALPIVASGNFFAKDDTREQVKPVAGSPLTSVPDSCESECGLLERH